MSHRIRLSIALTSSDTTEGTVSPANLTFTAANWSTAQTVTATGVQDNTVDGNQAYTIVTAPAVRNDRAYNRPESPAVPPDLPRAGDSGDRAGELGFLCSPPPPRTGGGRCPSRISAARPGRSFLWSSWPRRR